MSRVVKLDEHTGRVDVDVYLSRDGECVCPIWLTDRERYVVLSHLLPYSEWPTRFVRPVPGGLSETSTEEEFDAYHAALLTLITKLTLGD